MSDWGDYYCGRCEKVVDKSELSPPWEFTKYKVQICRECKEETRHEFEPRPCPHRGERIQRNGIMVGDHPWDLCLDCGKGVTASFLNNYRAKVEGEKAYRQLWQRAIRAKYQHETETLRRLSRPGR